jgi:hypothetical protein
VVLKLGGWEWGYQLLTVKNKLLTKILKRLRTWTDSLDKRPKRKKMDMRFGTGMHIGYWWESQKERDHWKNQDVGGWTILKWILER